MIVNNLSISSAYGPHPAPIKIWDNPLACKDALFKDYYFPLSACVGINTAPLKLWNVLYMENWPFFSVQLALVLRQKLLKREFQKLWKSSGPLWLAVMSKIKCSFWFPSPCNWNRCCIRATKTLPYYHPTGLIYITCSTSVWCEMLRRANVNTFTAWWDTLSS